MIAHENENDHADEPATTASTGFPHERLDAYRVALALAALANNVAASGGVGIDVDRIRSRSRSRSRAGGS